MLKQFFASGYFVQILPPQSGIGPLLVEVEIGLATAKQVHATATTRTKVLTARFMGISPYMRVPWERKP
jgi:hypothetical protein